MKAMRVIVALSVASSVSLACSQSLHPKTVLAQGAFEQNPPAAQKPDIRNADTRSVDLVGSDQTSRIAQASLTAAGPNKTRVVVKVHQPKPNTSYSANIYFGVCSDPSDQAAFTLTSFRMALPPPTFP